MKNLLILLGKRVHELRVAKKWSQEEFAHVSGLHRTYIGQVERGEKNISFGNLSKIAGVLGVTISELLAGLEAREDMAMQPDVDQRSKNPSARLFRIQKLVKQLRTQQAAMDRVTMLLEEAVSSGRSPRSRIRRKRK